MTIGVVGAGAFGTALAVALSTSEKVRLWARRGAEDMSLSGENPRLPGIALPGNVSPTGDMDELNDCQTVLLAVPMQSLRGVLDANLETLRDRTLVTCCKGTELGTGMSPLEIVGEILPGTPAAHLTGPSFAVDIARGLPAALTIASQDAGLGERLQALLSTPRMRLYRTTDTVGASIGGALKNVVAIACGTAMGAGLGQSARAALMTRGYAEMLRLATTLGARPDTLAGLSGFGDLALTCTSDQSRNYRLGLSLGRGETFDSGITVEGAATARAVAEMAGARGLDMPITEKVVALIDGRDTVGEAMADLLARPLKEE